MTIRKDWGQRKSVPSAAQRPISQTYGVVRLEVGKAQ